MLVGTIGTITLPIVWVFCAVYLIFGLHNKNCIGNEEIVNILIDAGAIQKQEALGFALERGIGQMIRPLVFRGIVPKHFEPKKGFGYYPQRFCSTH